MAAPNIKQLTTVCRQELDAVAGRSRGQVGTGGRSLQTDEMLRWVTDQQTRLNLFADVLGVFADATLSVEHRLRSNAAARSSVVQLLEAISRNTTLCARYTDEEPTGRSSAVTECHDARDPENRGQEASISRQVLAELSDSAVRRVGQDIASLVSFATSVRLRSMQQYNERSKRYEPQDENKRSLLPYFEKVVDGVLKDLIQGEDLEQVDTLRQRFKTTIIQRWRRICYCIYRFQQLKGPDRDLHDGSSEHKKHGHGSSQAAIRPQQKLDAQLIEKAAFPESQSQKATTFAGSLRPNSVGHRPHSIISSVAWSTTGEIVARVPKLRKDATSYRNGLLEFLCTLCKIPQQLISDQDPARRHRAWEKHAFHDLQPYICLFDGCKTSETTYRTFDEWKTHTAANHAQTTWACQNCTGVFKEQHSFESHILDDHGAALTPDQVELVAKGCTRRGQIYTACIFCGKYAAPSLDEAETLDALARREVRLLNCMAEHMRSLALTSLPDNLSVSVGSAGSDARMSGSSRALIVPAIQDNSDSPDIALNARFREALSQQQVEAIEDLNEAMSLWRDRSDIRDAENVPEDHMMLLEPPVEGTESDYVLTSTLIVDDFVGSGPPAYDGRSLKFDDKSTGPIDHQNMAKYKSSQHTSHESMMKGLETRMATETFKYLPRRRNEYFVGRSVELDTMERKYSVERDCQKMVVLGLGGIGKTEVALRFAYAVLDEHPDVSVFWVNAESAEAFEQAYQDIAEVLGMPILADGTEDVKKLVQKQLSVRTGGKWLLVVDNADDMDVLEGADGKDGLLAYLPESAFGMTVFTTRSSEVAQSLVGSEAIKLGTLTDREAKDLLRRALTRKDLLHDEAIVPELLFELGYTPHVISQAAAWINERKVSLSEFLARVYQGRGQFAKAVTLLLGVLEGQAELTENHPDRMASQHALAGAYKANGEVKKAVWLLEHVVEVEGRVLEEGHPDRLASQHALAGAYEANGQITEAVRLLEHVVKVEGRVLEEGHPDRLASQHALAGAYEANGQITEAVRLLEHVIKVREGILAEDHPSRLASQHALARAYQANGQIKQAVALLEHVVKVEEGILAEDHPDRLASQHELARAYQANGQIKQAVALLEYVVKVKEGILAEDHPSRLASQHDSLE